MSKTRISTFIKSVKHSIAKHSPEILTGIGIAGMVTTTILAVRATPKALMLLQDAQYDKGDVLTTSEKIKTCWKCYIPSAVTGTLSIACLIGASSTHLRRNAALATAYKISETALSNYKAKVIETVGEKKEQAIREKVAEEHVNRNPVYQHEVILTEKGNTLCFDVLSSRYFKSDIEYIKKTINELNRRMLNENYVSLNDFYYELGLQSTKIGDDIGWNIDRGFIDVTFGTKLTSEDKPCIVIDYTCEPRYGYNN